MDKNKQINELINSIDPDCVKCPGCNRWFYDNDFIRHNEFCRRCIEKAFKKTEQYGPNRTTN